MMKQFEWTVFSLAITLLLLFFVIARPTIEDEAVWYVVSIVVVFTCIGALFYVVKQWRATLYGILESLSGFGLMIWTAIYYMSDAVDRNDPRLTMIFFAAMSAWLFVFVSGLNNIREGLKTDPFRWR